MASDLINFEIFVYLVHKEACAAVAKAPCGSGETRRGRLSMRCSPPLQAAAATGSTAPQRTAHHAKAHGKHGHVPEIKGCLEHPRHFCLEEVVIRRVEVDVDADGRAAQEGV